jgi:hypothetical protein
VTAVEIGVDDVLPIEDQDVIVAIDAQTAQPARDPAIGERLRP